MNSIPIYIFAAICATVVQGGSVLLNETELQLNGIRNSIISDIDSLEYFINNTILLGNYKIQSRANEVISELTAETVHKIRLESDKAGEENEKAADCYKNAHLNASTITIYAVRHINPCVLKYLGVHDAAIRNITHIIQSYKTLYNRTKLLSSTPCVEKEGKPEDCSSKKLLTLETAYKELIPQSESVIIIALQAVHNKSEMLNDCIDKQVATLRKNLEKLQSDSIACIQSS